MILVIIAVLMTDTINTLTRTTDTVVTVVRERETHTLMMTHTKYSDIVSTGHCCFCNSPIISDPAVPDIGGTTSDGI